MLRLLYRECSICHRPKCGGHTSSKKRAAGSERHVQTIQTKPGMTFGKTKGGPSPMQQPLGNRKVRPKRPGGLFG